MDRRTVYIAEARDAAAEPDGVAGRDGDGLRVGGIVGDPGVGLGRGDLAPAPAHPVDGLVAGDAEDPGARRGAALEAGGGAPDLEEHVLHDVARVEGVAQPVAEEPVKGVRVALVERLQRLAVAGADAPEQVRVVHRIVLSLARGEGAGVGGRSQGETRAGEGDRRGASDACTNVAHR